MGGRTEPVGARVPGTETELLAAVREAINLQPGARVVRNNTGKLQDARGRWVTFGLGLGSPDLVGAVTVTVGLYGSWRPIARMFCLECKLPGRKLESDQVAWHAEAKSRAVFVATVHSVEEALAALERCRAGYVE